MFVKLSNNGNYKLKFPNFVFQEESLKDKLQNTLKELKTSKANKEGVKKVVLQSDQVLAQLKSTNGHATQNVLKRWQILMERTTNLSYHSSPSPFLNLSPYFTSDEIARLSYIPPTTSTSTSIERPMTKLEML
jgi:hypothetical protein